MSKRKDAGFQSSAGLVRNFEVDETKKPQVSPLMVILVPLGLLVALFLVLIIVLG